MMLLEGHAGPVRCLAYSPDGATLASGDDETVWLWDVAVGQVRAAGSDRSSEISCLAFSPDGGSLASGDTKGRVVLRNPATAQRQGLYGRQYEIRLHPDRINALAFAAGGRCLVSTAGGLEPEADRVADPGGWAEDWGWGYVAIRRRGYGGDDPGGQVALWSVADPCRPLILTGLDSIWGLAGDAGGRMMFFNSGDCNLASWSLGGKWFESWVNGKGSHQGYIPHSRVAVKRQRYFNRARPKTVAGPRPLAVSRNGRNLAAAWGKVIELWDTAEMRLRTKFPEHDDGISCLAFSPNGRTLASSSTDGTVRLWDFAEGRQRACYDWKIGPVHCVAIAPDGMTMAAGGDSGLVVWDVDETS